MKIAILSDSHDNAPNIEKALEWINQNKIDQIIHCGDLCAPSILAEILAPAFSGPIHLVFGNVEDRDLMPKVVKDFPNVKHYGDVGEIEIDKKKIAFVHFPDKAKELARSGKYDFVFYGHTHKPWEEKFNDCRLINPGTLAGLFNKATFAFCDTKTGLFELKILEKM